MSTALSWGKCPVHLYLYKSCTEVFVISERFSVHQPASVKFCVCSNSIEEAVYSVLGKETYSNRQMTYCYKPNTCNDRHSTILFILWLMHKELTRERVGLLFIVTFFARTLLQVNSEHFNSLYMKK